MPTPKKKQKEPEKKQSIEKLPLETWFKVKFGCKTDPVAFRTQMSMLNDKEANELYEVVKHAAYKKTYVEVLRDVPELKQIVRTRADFIFMLDIYRILTKRLGKTEPVPKDIAMIQRMIGGRFLVGGGAKK